MKKPRTDRTQKLLKELRAEIAGIKKAQLQYVTWQMLERKLKNLDTFVTREMLASLRDEIEEILTESTEELSRARKALMRRERIHEEMAKAETRVIAVQKEAKDMLGLLGLAQPPPPRHSPAMQNLVNWRYFHVWISRINERLEKLEQEKK